MAGMDWRGDNSTAPTLNLVVGTGYHNTANGKSYVYDGSLWLIFSEPGATGATGATGPQGIQGEPGDTGTPGATGQGFTWKGAWLTGSSYSTYDVVTDAGSCYECILAINPSNTAPGSDPAHFSLITSKGDTGAQGPQGIQGDSATDAATLEGYTWDNATFSGTLEVPTGGTSTYVIAAVDAPEAWKQKANVVCDGDNDQLDILDYDGTVVQLSPGTFTFGASCTLASNTTIRGCGPLTTCTLAAGSNSSVFKLTGVSDIDIEDMVIDGNSSNQSANGQLIKLETTTSRVLVKNCEIRSSYLDAVSCPSTSSFLTVQDCYIHDTTRYGAITSGAANVDFNHNRFANCGNISILFGSTSGSATHDCKAAFNTIVGGSAQGIAAIGDTASNRSYNIILSDNDILDVNNNSIQLNLVRDSTVSSNTCKWTSATKTGSGEGIDIYNSVCCSITGNTSTGHVHATNGTGISLDTTSNYNSVTGNTCNYNSLAGIYIWGSSYNTVTGNTCTNNSSRGIGIDSAGNSSYNDVSHNECNDDGAAVQAYGIWEVSNNNNTITFNTCQGNTTAQILPSGANTLVIGNKGYAPVVISNSNTFDPSYFTQIMSLGNFQIVPTSGWTSTLVGTGAVSSASCYNDVHTGTTANSSAFYAVGPLPLLGPASGSNSASRITWDKKMYIMFNVAMWGNDTEVVRRIQLKQATTIGALAALGVDVEIDNFALKGNSYGSGGLGTVSLGATVTQLNNVQIIIVHTPGVSDAWYVNGVLKGTQSNATLIPSGQSTADNRFCTSVSNGATGTVDDYLRISGISIWQER